MDQKGACKGDGLKVHFFSLFREKVALFDQKYSRSGSYVKFQVRAFHGFSGPETVQGSKAFNDLRGVPRLNVGAARKIFCRKFFIYLIC